MPKKTINHLENRNKRLRDVIVKKECEIRYLRKKFEQLQEIIKKTLEPYYYEKR